MIVGSESSRFWVVKLNRSYDAAGLVQVAPEVVFTDEAWDEQVLADNGGDEHASVESSVTVVGDVAYFGTSAGLVLGYDLSGLDDGRDARSGCSASTPPATTTRRSSPTTRGSSTRPRRTTGRRTPRAQAVGQLQKLDPRKPENPMVWSFQETTVGRAGPLRHAGGPRRRRDRHQRPGPADRPRPRHRRGALGAHAGRRRVGQPGGGGRRAADRRLRGDDLPRLRRGRPARRATRALVGRPRRVHRGHARRSGRAASTSAPAPGLPLRPRRRQRGRAVGVG